MAELFSGHAKNSGCRHGTRLKVRRQTMNRIEKLFYCVGVNPLPFLFGWLSGMIGLILGLLILHIK
jgi:hypothetical protein